MALLNLDGMPVMCIGAPLRGGHRALANAGTLGGALIANNAAVAMIGHVWTSDRASHTLTTGSSSSLGWRTGAVTYAGASVVKVGLAAVDTTSAAPGRPNNTANVVNFLCSRTITGPGGITANAWNEHVPDTGSLTVNNGDLLAFVVQMTTRAGSDSVIAQGVAQSVANMSFPYVSWYNATTWANTTSHPCCVITFADGVRGYFSGGYVQNGTLATSTWNSSAGTKEYGNYVRLPVPCRVYGIAGQVALTAGATATELVLYTTPLGTPVAQRTVSLLPGQAAIATNADFSVLFPTPLDLDADEEVVVAFKPGTASISASYRTVAAALHMESDGLSYTRNYAVLRGTGSFGSATVNPQRDKYAIGVLVSAFAHPARSGFALGI